ncbi:P-loop containing nucleoside triphosphate hydrolase protein, partial [Baffinella frigidus]
MGCVECNMPVLLEGPAAVGKTSLIDFLSKQMPRRQKQGDSNTESAILLLRVNNSASTTVQDYLGSYLPSGDGDFVFREGALLKAMRCGYWFLADEFNLAEPAVMSLLYPILEGQTSISVPGTDVVVQAHGDFRFFATQNDAKGYAGRFVLPVSLRNRMLEVQVRDFDAQELPDVIRKRRE